MEGLTYLFIGLGGLALIVLIGAVVFFFRMRSYLAKAHEGVEGTASEIVEEIDSYQTKTQ